MSTPPFASVAVIGCGVVGGSIALASRALPGVRRVVVTDHDPQVRERAQALGLADDVVDDPAQAVAGADLVVLAIPVPAIAQLLADVSMAIPPRAVVTDVGSVKSLPLREIESLARNGGITADVLKRYVPGHPMAGSERHGPDAADASLFQGATWVLTPHEHVDSDAFHRLGSHLRDLGARVLAVTPELHDRLVALTSHVPQLLASTLMAEAAQTARSTGEAVLSITGGGFRDATRVAGSDPHLWTGILASNQPAVLAALDGFVASLGDLRDAIAADDWSRVEAVLATAQSAHHSLPRKARAERLVLVVVPVDDAPGMLATVTTALGEAGVNIEDLSMRHAGAGDRGALVVAVDGDAAARRAESLLAERGVAAHLEGG